MLSGNTYEEIRRNFRWRIPVHYNIGVDVCDKWARREKRLALVHVGPGDQERRFTFGELKSASNRLANGLQSAEIRRGDRVGIYLPQCPETLLSHLAVYKLGAVAMPLLTLFGPMAVEHRMKDSGARCVITDAERLPTVLDIRERLPELTTILCVGKAGDETIPEFWSFLGRGRADFNPAPTAPDDPALLIYTSGTTGPPKGTLHGHRLLLGVLPGFAFFHNLFPRAGDLMYTPLDWAYIGGSYDALFPALHFGVPVLGFRPRKFDPDKAFRVMARHGATNLMAVPTVLRKMRSEVENPKERYRLRLRSITVGGEPLGEDIARWCQDRLGVVLNEHYGQTECDMVVGFCSAVMPVKPGCMGKAAPGHEVAIIDADGQPLPVGEQGEIAVKRPDPVMFLGYWNQPEATAEKVAGGWLHTGDLGQMDDEGHFRFKGRCDELIESGGYRIGPGEIEDCLLRHPAVQLACVLGVPDPVRGQKVKAFIVPTPGVTPDDALKESIRRHVRDRLEAHAYPREIEFLEAMPLTRSGKIRKADLRKR